MSYDNISQNELEELVLKKDGNAMCELGKRYRYGEKGTEKNLTLAYRMYHKAEKLGAKEAFLALAQMYENGEYFGKNMQIAQEYYAKAGIQSNIHTPSHNHNMQNSMHSAENHSLGNTNAIHQSMSIKSGLQQAEKYRAQGNTAMAKQLVQQALQEIGNGNVQTEQERQTLEVEAYWLLAYIGFNEQDYTTFQNYISKTGVLEQHPWGNYLLGIVHKILKAEDNILFQDMQNMLNSLNSPKLKETELGDVLGMLGDLCLAGITNGTVEPTQQAYEFYNNAANLGNQYAVEQKSKFKKNLFGKMIYHG